MVKEGPVKYPTNAGLRSEAWVMSKTDYMGCVGISMGRVNLIYSRGDLCSVLDSVTSTAYVSKDIEYYRRAIVRLLEKYGYTIVWADNLEIHEKFTSLIVNEAAREMDRRLMGGSHD